MTDPPPQSTTKAARRGQAANLLALLLGCGLALVVTEVSLRIRVLHSSRGVSDADELRRSVARMPPPFAGRCGGEASDARFGEIIRPSDVPDLVYELKPGIDTCFKGVRVQTNGAGLRAPREYARPKPDGTYRVLLLGDSQTFGHGVEHEETFGQVLERRLQEQLPLARVEVINSGVGGYNLYQEAVYLVHEGLSFEPDLVVILFIGNDLELPIFLISTRGPLATDRLYTGELIASLLRRDATTEPLHALVPNGLYVPREYLHMAGVEAYRVALRRIADATREHRIPVLNFVDEGIASLAFGSATTRAEIRELARSLGIVEPPFVFPNGFELSADDAHLNPEGHRRLAAQMLDALRASETAAHATEH